MIIPIFARSVAPSVGPTTISPVKTNSIVVKPLNILFRHVKCEREVSPPSGFSTLTPLHGPNMGKLPPITVSTFIAKTPKNTPLANHASTSANPDLVIRPAFVEANKVLESLLKERIKHMHNEDLRTELDYYSEEQRGRVVEFKDAPNRDKSRVERDSEGRRPSEQRAEDTESYEVNLPQLLVARLRRNDNSGNPSFGGPPAYHPCGRYASHASLRNYGPTHDGFIYPLSAPPNSYPFYTQPINPLPNAPTYPNYDPRALFTDSTSCVTPFICWIEDYPLPDELKMPSHVGSYDGKGDPGNYFHLFKGAIRMQKWAMPVARHMFTILLKIPPGYGEMVKKQRLPPMEHQLITKKALIGSIKALLRTIEKERKNRYRFSPYKGSNHELLSNLSKSPREILATEKAAKAFEQPPRMELRHQIKEAVKSGKLAHLVKGIKTRKLKETLPEATKDILSCADIKERDIVNDKHQEQTVVIGKQLPTSFKRKMQDLLRSNVDVFACTYADMIGIPRTIMVEGKPIITKHRLNKHKHIKPVKQKKRGLAPEQNEAYCKEVEELLKADILHEVTCQTVLQGVELNYPELEKLILALVYAARRLRRYFQAHPIWVLADKPIKKILTRPKKSKQIDKWAIELEEHDIEYKGCNSVKGHVLADFLAKTPSAEGENMEIKKPKTINEESTPQGKEYTNALRFEFKTTNNTVEYEALLDGLRIAVDMKFKDLSIFVDSQLVANQVKGLSKQDIQ
nr:reverse transcriptase domain-containing protein [Tanacetum cinerariifolium]